jgi:small-conductance mechanosensitive channel
VVQQIIARLQGFEETIKALPKPERPNPERLAHLESSLVELDNQIHMVSQRNPTQRQHNFNYETEREHLFKDINFLEQILEDEKNEFNETNKLLEKNLEVYKATIEQPINNFDVNLSRQASCTALLHG